MNFLDDVIGDLRYAKNHILMWDIILYDNLLYLSPFDFNIQNGVEHYKSTRSYTSAYRVSVF